LDRALTSAFSRNRSLHWIAVACYGLTKGAFDGNNGAASKWAVWTASARPAFAVGTIHAVAGLSRASRSRLYAAPVTYASRTIFQRLTIRDPSTACGRAAPRDTPLFACAVAPGGARRCAGCCRRSGRVGLRRRLPRAYGPSEFTF
jgi:hypothetical protein